ncbi:MAG: DUF3090 family protein [Acidimicrobiia bacterium]|nr:DUF3090 family protein [Actinomycetota bacterium]MBL6924355.1 DUF3090 family protein [Acidimicrobiia bacterium]
MERPDIDWDDTDGFTNGTVGPAGRRVFFIQAHRKGEVVSLKLEKQQMAGLAEFLDKMLADLPPVSHPSLHTDDHPAHDAPAFEAPEEADWVVGSLGVTYQQSTDRLVLIAEELIRDEDLKPAQARFPLRREQIASFVESARALVAAGRPPCEWCGAPLEPESGGWCPCAN